MNQNHCGKKYSIGVDFGTQSGRAVLVDLETGSEIAVAIQEYSHGVMDEYLPDKKTRLMSDWALQHPGDYLEVLKVTIPKVLKEGNVSPKNVVGIGIDFTACTVMPVYQDGTPLCFMDRYQSNPHAYVKLWKHHAAQEEANKINAIANLRGEPFLARYGGKISSEWLFPKLWQILNEDEALYHDMDRFIEAADWVIWQLTGEERRNSCTAGYKAIWSKKEGYPSNEFFKALDPRLNHVVKEKLSENIYPVGQKAGEISEKAAKLTGLSVGTAVAIANVDAHVSLPAVGITDPGKMLMIMGTSTCHVMLGKDEKVVRGMCGVVEDGILQGYSGYEAGQSCVGDHFEWFVQNCVGKSDMKEAESLQMDIHSYLSLKASKLSVGESGLVALDWWNGNRSILVDVDLTGMVVGLTLQTKPEEIYRALIEATAFGTRRIIEEFNCSGVEVQELYACGGIAEKNEFMMQVYADVTNMEIKVSASPQTPALGAAIFGAVAAGGDKGGFDNIIDAATVMAKVKDKKYRPISGNVQLYDQLYDEYKKLHDYFADENLVMKRLKQLKSKALGEGLCIRK